MKLIIVRPRHDVTTRYLFSWAQEIINLARKKGIDILDLARDKARREELEGRIQKIQPDLLFLNGHGNDDSITGHNDEVLIKAGENHQVLRGKITYALSCNAGKKLGPMVAKEIETTFIGYKDEFIFVADANYLTRPLDDPKARPFKEASNQVMVSLLKGNKPEEASAKSKSKFKECYSKLLASNTDPDSLQMAQCLWWDMRHQVCLEYHG